jgi:hypothetical protein
VTLESFHSERFHFTPLPKPAFHPVHGGEITDGPYRVIEIVAGASGQHCATVDDSAAM